MRLGDKEILTEEVTPLLTQLKDKEPPILRSGLRAFQAERTADAKALGQE